MCSQIDRTFDLTYCIQVHQGADSSIPVEELQLTAKTEQHTAHFSVMSRQLEYLGLTLIANEVNTQQDPPIHPLLLNP